MDILSDIEFQRLVDEKIMSMPALNRIVMQYFYYDELSVSEIAMRLSKDVIFVKKILAKVRLELKEFIVGNYKEPKGNLYSLGAVPFLWLEFGDLLVSGSGVAATAVVGSVATGNAAGATATGGVATGNAAGATATGGVATGNAAGATATGGVATGNAAGMVVASTKTTVAGGFMAGFGAKLAVGAVVAGLVVGIGAATVNHVVSVKDETTTTEHTVDEITIQEQAETTEEVILSNAELYKDYICNEIVEVDGMEINDINRLTVDVENITDMCPKWFSPNGQLLGYHIGDFMGDEEDELALFYTEDLDDSNLGIAVQLYNVVDGKVELVETEYLGGIKPAADEENFGDCIKIYKGTCSDEYLNISVCNRDDKCVIVTKYSWMQDLIATGHHLDASIISADENGWNKELSFGYTGSSIEFVTVYELIDGELVSKKVDESSDSYNEEFENHGVSADFMKQDILEDNEDAKTVFEISMHSERKGEGGYRMLAEWIDYSGIEALVGREGVGEQVDGEDLHAAPIEVSIEYDASKHDLAPEAELMISVDVMDETKYTFSDADYESEDGLTLISFDYDYDMSKPKQRKTMKFSNVDNYYNICIDHMFMMCSANMNDVNFIVTTPNGKYEYNWRENSDMLYRSYTGAWMFGFGIKNGEIVKFDTSKYARE